MPTYSTEHNRIQTRQLLYRYSVRSAPIILSFVLISQTLDIELVFLQSHLDNFALLNSASIFFAVSIELYGCQYKAWQMTSSDDDSTIFQEGLRLEQQDALSDLDEAIKLYAAALALCPPGHNTELEYINSLATSLSDRFQQHGTLSELEDVIELHRATLIFYPPHHALRSNYMNNLAVSLCDRFRQQGALSDLDEATEFYRAALALRSPGHSLIHVSTTLPAAFQPNSWNVPPHLT